MFKTIATKKISFIDAQHELWDFLVDNHKTTILEDQQFATSELIKTTVFDFIAECKLRKIKTTFNNLTNMNLHLLVHILVLNDFFKKLEKGTKEYYQAKPIATRYN
jgi:hypothetical protein